MRFLSNAGTFLALVLCLPAVGRAQTITQAVQQFPDQLNQDQYVSLLATKLDQWNQSDLKFPPKTVLAQLLRKRLEVLGNTGAYPYERQRAWADDILKKFDELPQNLTPVKRLDPSAAMTLLLLFLKGLDQTEKVDKSQLLGDIDLSLFMILGRAQQNAQSAPTMNTAVINKSLLDWWTSVFPFCS